MNPERNLETQRLTELREQFYRINQQTDHPTTPRQMFEEIQKIMKFNENELEHFFGTNNINEIIYKNEGEDTTLVDGYITTLQLKSFIKPEYHSELSELVNIKASKLYNRSYKEVFLQKQFEYLIIHYEKLFSWSALG